MMPSGPIQVRRGSAEDRLPGRGLLASPGRPRDIDIHLVVPTPRIFGIPPIADSLDEAIADYGIQLHTMSEVTSVDADSQSHGDRGR